MFSDLNCFFVPFQYNDMYILRMTFYYLVLIGWLKRFIAWVRGLNGYTQIAQMQTHIAKELNWQTFPERVTYQKAILMYRIINNIIMSWLFKKLCLILDLLTVTNYIRQNLTANFSASPSYTLDCHLELSPPTCLKCNFG